MNPHTAPEFAVFPAFSFGTRLLPLTYEHPKELLAVGNRTLLHHAMREARLAGIEKFVFIVIPSTDLHPYTLSSNSRKNLQSLEELASRWPGQYGDTVAVTREWFQLLENVVAYVPLRFDIPAGLGQAVRSVESFIGNSPFAFFLPDDYIGNPESGMPALLNAWRENRGWAISLSQIEPAQIDEFGVVRIRPCENKPTGCLRVICAREKRRIEGQGPIHAIVGRYVFDENIFKLLRETQDEVISERSQSGFHITEAIHRHAMAGKVIGLQLDDSFFHAGTLPGYYDAWRYFLAHRPSK